MKSVYQLLSVNSKKDRDKIPVIPMFVSFQDIGVARGGGSRDINKVNRGMGVDTQLLKTSSGVTQLLRISPLMGLVDRSHGEAS